VSRISATRGGVSRTGPTRLAHAKTKVCLSHVSMKSRCVTTKAMLSGGYQHQLERKRMTQRPLVSIRKDLRSPCVGHGCTQDWGIKVMTPRHPFCRSHTHNYEWCRPRGCIQKTLPAASWQMANAWAHHGRCIGTWDGTRDALAHETWDGTWDAWAHEMPDERRMFKRCILTTCLVDCLVDDIFMTTSFLPTCM